MDELNKTFPTYVLNDPKASAFYTTVLGKMTKDENLQISAVDVSPILLPVPEYISPRK